MVSLLLTLISVVILIPSLILFIEIVLGAQGFQRKTVSSGTVPSLEDVGILIPAHNEAGIIAS
ncbi:MAG: hypothetical protein AAF603_07605, partial [Pseudomonadota bacterium]